MPTITSHYPTTIPDLYMESLAVSQIQSHDHLSSGGKRNTMNRGEKAGGGRRRTDSHEQHKIPTLGQAQSAA